MTTRATIPGIRNEERHPNAMMRLLMIGGATICPMVIPLRTMPVAKLRRLGNHWATVDSGGTHNPA